MDLVKLLIAMGLAYLAGSIPTGLWMGRWLLGIDLREHGSGNLGATNAFRILGRKIGAAVLILDVLKGLLPVIFLPRVLGLSSTPGTELLIGGAAIAGHIFSMFVSFKGGKGVATALGVFLAVATTPMLIVLAIGVVIIVITGYVSLASITGAVLLPILIYFSSLSPIVLVVSCIISIMVIVRHRTNIKRLYLGGENRIYGGNPAKYGAEPAEDYAKHALPPQPEES
jgi:acyl phosphate:glycerol-3-phosphate acyltransferase